jgi:hypothetical protein
MFLLLSDIFRAEAPVASEANSAAAASVPTNSLMYKRMLMQLLSE